MQIQAAAFSTNPQLFSLTLARLGSGLRRRMSLHVPTILLLTVLVALLTGALLIFFLGTEPLAPLARLVGGGQSRRRRRGGAPGRTRQNSRFPERRPRKRVAVSRLWRDGLRGAPVCGMANRLQVALWRPGA